MPSRQLYVQAAGIAALAAAVLAILSGVGPGQVVGGGQGDFASIAWGLWRTAEALPGLPSAQTDLIFAPRGATLVLADLPEALLLAPLTALLGPVFSFNLLQLAHPALAIASMFLLLRTEGRSLGAAAAGGAMFGLSPVLLTGLHNGNPDVTPIFLLPLVVLAARRVHSSVRAAVLAGVLIGLAPWFNPYVGVMAAVTAAVMTPRERPAHIALAAAIALALAAAFAALVLSSFSAPDAMVHKPGGPAAAVPPGVAHLRGFFLPLLEPQADGWSLHGWYLGGVGLLAACFSGRGQRLRCGLLIIAGLILSMGPVLQIDTQTVLAPGGWRIALPGALFQDLPGLSSLKISYRFAALIALGLAPLAARGIDRLPRGQGVVAGLVAVELLLLGAPLLASGPRPSEDVCALLTEQPVGPVVSLPSGRDEVHLLLQTCHGFPIAQGINQPYPRPIRQSVQGKGARTFDALASHGFRYLVLHHDLAAGDDTTARQLARLQDHAEEQGRILGATERTVLVALVRP